MHASELQWLYPYHVFFKSFQGKSNEASLALFSKIHWSIRWWHLFLYYSSETHLTLQSIAWSGNLKAFKYDSLNDQGISIAGWHTYTKPCVFLLCRNTRVSVLPNLLGPTYNSPGELSTMWWEQQLLILHDLWGHTVLHAGLWKTDVLLWGTTNVLSPHTNTSSTKRTLEKKCSSEIFLLTW